MSHFTDQRRTSRPAPLGIATLEFAMALPFLLLLMIGITWLAYSVIGQAEVLIQARDNAWGQRFKDKSKQPLLFPVKAISDDISLYSYDDDYAVGTATKKVDISPVFNGTPSPKGTCTVLAGSWDYNAMDLNSPPNIKLYLRAAANAVTKNIQTQLGQLTNLVDNVQNMGAAGILQAITKSNNAVSESKSSESAGDAGKSQADADKERDKAALEKRQNELGGVVNPSPFGNHDVIPLNGGQLDQTNDEIDRVQRDLDAKKKAPADPDKDKEKQRQADLDKEERELSLLKDKKQRIEAEIRDNQEELDGFK